jgi:hypothetical protein
MGHRILGLGFGIFGIAVLDLGFAGSSLTDLFHVGNYVSPISPTSIPGNTFFASLAPGGNIILFLIGGIFLASGMVILIMYNRNLAKLPTVATPSK